MAQKDFYHTLGLKPNAAAEEIKSAYRRLARAYHPDATGGDHDKAERFREVSRAYEVLSDAKKRAIYDLTQALSGSPAGSRTATPPPADAKPQRAPFPRTTTPTVTRGQGGDRPGQKAPPDKGRPPGKSDPPAASQGAGKRPGPAAQGPGFGRPQRPLMRGRMTISREEALLGAEKLLTLDLPDGTEREVVVRVPIGARDGETILAPLGDDAGDILLELAVDSA